MTTEERLEKLERELTNAKARPIVDLDVLDEIQMPKLMMIWKIEP